MNWIEGTVTVVCCFLVYSAFVDALKALKEIKIAEINADTFKDDKK